MISFIVEYSYYNKYGRDKIKNIHLCKNCTELNDDINKFIKSYRNIKELKFI